jgi:hypothetical protein
LLLEKWSSLKALAKAEQALSTRKGGKSTGIHQLNFRKKDKQKLATNVHGHTQIRLKDY